MAYRSGVTQPVTELRCLGGVSVDEKLQQLISMIGSQQELIADFVRENKDVWSSLSEVQCSVESLGSSFKDYVASNMPIKFKKN